jgi:hypothetical protein
MCCTHTTLYLLAGALASLIAAASSWRRIACEGLHNEIAQVLQGLKQALIAAGTWEAQIALVEQPAMQKCTSMFQL